MKGINLDKPITFLHSSLRFFSENEYHVTRLCKSDVLIMVYKGVLRFIEDGTSYEIHPGEYHIQKSLSYQTADKPSDSPEYLYVHFNAEWADGDFALPFKGCFDCDKAKPLMNGLDMLSHGKATLLEKSAKFYELLLSLRQKEASADVADKIADFINGGNLSELTLDSICREFHFSKNHIINVFKSKFGTTPVKYINNVKLSHARRLLEATSDTIESIALQSGFNDYSHFYKLFRRENNRSPELWRKEKHKEPLL